MANKRFLLILIIAASSCVKRIDNTDTKYTYQLSRLKSEYFNIYQKLLTNFKNEHIDLEKAVGNFVNIQQLFFFEASKTAW
jgi:hypothetical protein